MEPITSKRETIPDDPTTCEDNYYLCVIPMWRILSGWFEFFGVLCTIATAFLGALAALDTSMSDSAKINVGIAIAVVGCAATSFQLLKSHAAKAVIDRKNQLIDTLTFPAQINQLI